MKQHDKVVDNYGWRTAKENAGVSDRQYYLYFQFFEGFHGHKLHKEVEKAPAPK